MFVFNYAAVCNIQNKLIFFHPIDEKKSLISIITHARSPCLFVSCGLRSRNKKAKIKNNNTHFENLMHSYISEPNIASVDANCDSMRHVEQVSTPASLDPPGLGIENQNRVDRNRSLGPLLEVEALIEGTRGQKSLNTSENS